MLRRAVSKSNLITNDQVKAMRFWYKTPYKKLIWCLESFEITVLKIKLHLSEEDYVTHAKRKVKLYKRATSTNNDSYEVC